MKLRIEKDTLADAVAWTAKGLPVRPSVPVLAGIMLRASDGVLTVSGFDYDVSNQVSAQVETDADGAALVSGRLLAEICKALPAKPVDIASVGVHMELVCGSARFTLPTMAVADYPALPEMPASAGTVDAAAFAAAVQQVAVAAGRDEALPMMTGVRMELRGGTMSLLSTDRYRLAHADIPWNPDDPGIEADALVPAKTLTDTVKTLGARGGAVRLSLTRGSVGEGMIGLSVDGPDGPDSPGSRRTTSRLLDGANYPPVRSLFPDKHNSQAKVAVAALSEVVKRVALVAERNTPVRLSFNADDGLVVEAGGTEDARASEAMDATYTGEPLTIAFNPAYLLDGIAALSAPTAVFSFIDAFKAAVLTGADAAGEPVPGYRYLIMPIRVAR